MTEQMLPLPCPGFALIRGMIHSYFGQGEPENIQQAAITVEPALMFPHLNLF